MNEIKIGIYKHYKGKLYQVIGTAKYSEDIAIEYVIYKQLYTSTSSDGITLPIGTIWARPKKMFSEYVTLQDGNRQERFKFIPNDSL